MGTPAGAVRLCLAFTCLLSLAACGARVVAGDANTVSVETGPFGNVEATAREHCAEFGKSAVPIGGGYLGPGTTRRIYAFNCVEE